MAEEIFIADKKTLDEVNKNTNTIKESAQFIKEHFPIKISGGTDWSKYNKCFADKKEYKNDYGAEKLTILDIKGEGYLTEFSIGYEEGAGNEKTDIKIILDDKEIYAGKLRYNSSQKRTITFTCSFSNLNVNSFCFPQPLFFNKSFVIELKNVTGYRIGYEYGGVIKA